LKKGSHCADNSFTDVLPIWRCPGWRLAGEAGAVRSFFSAATQRGIRGRVRHSPQPFLARLARDLADSGFIPTQRAGRAAVGGVWASRWPAPAQSIPIGEVVRAAGTGRPTLVEIVLGEGWRAIGVAEPALGRLKSEQLRRRPPSLFHARCSTPRHWGGRVAAYFPPPVRRNPGCPPLNRRTPGISGCKAFANGSKFEMAQLQIGRAHPCPERPSALVPALGCRYQDGERGRIHEPCRAGRGSIADSGPAPPALLLRNTGGFSSFRVDPNGLRESSALGGRFGDSLLAENSVHPGRRDETSGDFFLWAVGLRPPRADRQRAEPFRGPKQGAEAGGKNRLLCFLLDGNFLPAKP